MAYLAYGIIFAILLAYAGKTIPGRVYLVWAKKRPHILTVRDMDIMKRAGMKYISFANILGPILAGLSLWPLLEEWALAAAAALALMFANSPAKWFIGQDMGEWYPAARLGMKRRLQITAGLFARYSIGGDYGGALPVAAALWYLVGWDSLYIVPLAGLTISLGYFLSSFIKGGGDLQGKLLSGAPFGAAVVAVINKGGV